VALVSLPMVSLAQTAGDFRSNGAVTFADATNWQTYNGTAWVAAAVAPTSADGAILIMGPHTAEVTTNVTLNQLSVEGILQVNNGATLTLADGAGDDLFVRNRLFFQATGVVAGAGKLVLGNQAIVQTANVGGLAGSITSTNPTLTAGASYWFNGTTAQSTGFTGFASLGNPLHFHFKNTAGITIDRNLTITGTLTANNNVPITIGAGVTNFTANAIYNGGSFNNCVGATITPAFTNSSWASPKGIYQSPDSSKPTTESSNIWTNSHKTTAHIYWMQSGSGNNRIVVLKAGSAVSPTAAIDNTTYTANAAFGTGTAIDGGFVVYNGAGSQVNVTGLTEGTTYHVAVFEYNQDCGTNRNYKTGTPLTTSFVAEERPFITEWITTDGTLTIPTTGGGYNYNVSYRILPAGVPTVLIGQTGSVTLNSLTNGVTYEISITGTFPRIAFGGATAANRAKIRNIKQWGSVQWTSMEGAYQNCNQLNSNATDVPNLSNVSIMQEMFIGCSIFNGGNIANWNTTSVTNMSSMFRNATSFNQPIGSWNTQNINNMSNMFQQAAAFNQPIGSWNTQNLNSMSSMFQQATSFNQHIGAWNITIVAFIDTMFWEATSFNQPIGTWNTASATFMNFMFNRATSFNQPIGSWNTQNVTMMGFMFYQASAFNQPIGTWNTGAVTNMNRMFRNATAFNQSLAGWNIMNITHNPFPPFFLYSMSDMLNNCGINTANYDATLISWAAQNVKTGVNLGAGGRVYSVRLCLLVRV
jgi:surface protein